jgi:proline iminopeptidase
VPPEFEAMMAEQPTTDEELATGMARLFPAYFHHPERVDLEAVVAGTIYRAAPMVRGFELLSRWSSVDRLGAITTPTLVVAGRHDVFTSWPQAYRIARRMPDAEVVIFEDSGHFPFVEVPGAFFATVRRWLEEHGRS